MLKTGMLILAATAASAGGRPEAPAAGLVPPGSPARTVRWPTIIVKEFVYKKTPQGELKVHVQFPADWTRRDRRPAAVFFSGGGWSANSVTQFIYQADYLTLRGMVTARADYRVRGRHETGVGEAVEDAKSVVRWLRANAKQLGIDPGRVVAGGGSAGGHLAACAGTTDTHNAKAEDASVSSRPNLMILCNPALKMGDRSLSPADHVGKDTPPCVLFYGTRDSLLAGGVAYVAQAARAGCQADLYVAVDQKHGFFNHSPWREAATRKMDEFLTSHGYLAGRPLLDAPGDARFVREVPTSYWLSFLSVEAVLAEPDRPGAAMRCAIGIRNAPFPLTGSAEWRTEGTDWRAKPAKFGLKLAKGDTELPAAALTCTGRTYPLPTFRARLTHPSGERTIATRPLLAPPAARVETMRAAPVIDGKIAPAEIAGLSRRTGLLTDNGPAKVQAEFYCGVAGGRLYVAVLNHEPDVGKLMREGDIFGTDRNEVYVALPGETAARTYAVNAGGRRYPKAGDGPAWRGACSIGQTSWTTEFLIPLARGSLRPEATFRFNLFRQNKVSMEWSTWCPSGYRRKSDPRHMGRMTVGAAGP